MLDSLSCSFTSISFLTNYYSKERKYIGDCKSCNLLILRGTTSEHPEWTNPKGDIFALTRASSKSYTSFIAIKLNLKKITTRGNPPEYAGILPEALVTMNSKKNNCIKIRLGIFLRNSLKKLIKNTLWPLVWKRVRS